MNYSLALLAACVLTLPADDTFAQKTGTTSGTSPDGAVMIDQARVTTGSVTPGDTVGFPLTITQNGRYRLSSNLVVPAGLDGIVVAAGVDAIIDMNGFSITGAATCSRTVNCFQSGGTHGIRTATGTSVQVQDGRIRGFSLVGVGHNFTVPQSTLRLTDVHLHQNGYGVFAARLQALRVQAEDNSMVGIQGMHGSIAESHAIDNGNIGFVLSAGVLRANVATKNSYGFLLYSTTVAIENVAFSNLGGSVVAGGGTPVSSMNAF